MNKKTVVVIKILIIILLVYYTLPLSTITNYRDGSKITFHLNRTEINTYSIDAVLYNVEKQYGFVYIASWCPYNSYSCKNVGDSDT